MQIQKSSHGNSLIKSKISYQVYLLEDTSEIKLSLNHDDGLWCENIHVPELKLLPNQSSNEIDNVKSTSDHLVLFVEQKRGHDQGTV